MHAREFLVLDGDDRALVDRLAVGLGENAARVLAYLLLRERREGERTDPATRLTVRIGTGLSREAVTAAVAVLSKRGLVGTTTVRRSERGRPPKAWHSTVEAVPGDVYETHAEALLAQSKAVAEAVGVGHERNTPTTAGTDCVRVGLNWRPNGLHAPIYAAAAGRYEDAGLNVTVEPFEGSDRAVEAVETGTVDVALTGAATVVRSWSAGVPIVPLALLYQRAMTVLYADRARFGERLESVEQLRGVRVGMPVSSETGLLGRLLLSQAGVLDDAEVVDLSGEERTALRSGRVDVVTGQFRDPRELRNAGTFVDALPVADHFPMYGPALVTADRTVRERGSLLRRFLAGTIHGWADAVRRPAAGLERLSIDDTERRREQHAFERAVEEFGRSETVTAHGWGWHEPDGWRRLRTALDQVELLSGAGND